MLSLQGIYKRYRVQGRGVVIADNLNLELAENQIIGLVGSSGCGKSTIGRMALGLEAPDRGEVFLDGQDISTMNRKEAKAFRRSVQLVVQHPDAAFNPRRTLSASLAEVFRFHRVCPQGEERAYLAAALDHVRIHGQLLERYPAQLSGGELQRMAIARSILTKPRFLLLDEVTSMLDVSVQATTIRTLEELRDHHRMGYLFITHNLGLAQVFCDRILRLDRGRLELFSMDVHRV